MASMEDRKMVRTKVIATISLCIIVVMGIGSWFLLQSIEGWEQYASQLETDLDEMASQIVDLQTQVRESELDYQNLQSEHNGLQIEYDSLSEEYERFETRFAVMFDSRYEEGYDAGYVKGLEATGYDIRNPTYNEVLQFVRSDRTDRNEYVEGKYICWNFVGDFKNNAFETGYRCGFVYIDFQEGAHAIACFNTTDRGMIYIETQDDSIVTLVIGEHYWDRSKYLPEYDDTIVKFGIIW